MIGDDKLVYGQRWLVGLELLPGCKSTRIALSSALFLTGPQGLMVCTVVSVVVVSALKLYRHVKSTRIPVKCDPNENTNGGGAGVSSIEAVSSSLLLSAVYVTVVVEEE